MTAVMNVLSRGVRKEVENIREFITTPKGPFQTLDEMVVDARRTGRELVQTIRPGLVGQKIEPVERLRRRIRILRR